MGRIPRELVKKLTGSYPKYQERSRPKIWTPFGLRNFKYPDEDFSHPARVHDDRRHMFRKTLKTMPYGQKKTYLEPAIHSSAKKSRKLRPKRKDTPSWDPVVKGPKHLVSDEPLLEEDLDFTDRLKELILRNDPMNHVFMPARHGPNEFKAKVRYGPYEPVLPGDYCLYSINLSGQESIQSQFLDEFMTTRADGFNMYVPTADFPDSNDFFIIPFPTVSVPLLGTWDQQFRLRNVMLGFLLRVPRELRLRFARELLEEYMYRSSLKPLQRMLFKSRFTCVGTLVYPDAFDW